jgi:hypothetical protein
MDIGSAAIAGPLAAVTMTGTMTGIGIATGNMIGIMTGIGIGTANAGMTGIIAGTIQIDGASGINPDSQAGLFRQAALQNGLDRKKSGKSSNLRIFIQKQKKRVFWEAMSLSGRVMRYPKECNFSWLPSRDVGHNAIHGSGS